MYSVVALQLSNSDLDKLMKGVTVSIKPENVGVGSELSLTMAQANRLYKNSEAGKSTKLKLSKALIKHNMKKMFGAGFTDDLLNYSKPLINLGRDAVQKELSNQSKKQLNNLTNMLSSKLPSGYVQDTINFLGNQGANNVDNFLKTLLSDENINKSLNRLRGSGFLDDLLSPVTSVVRNVANNAVPLATNILSKTLENKINQKFGGNGFKPKKIPDSNKYGMKKKCKKQMDYINGSGWFDSVVDVVSTPVRMIEKSPIGAYTPVGIARQMGIDAFNREMNKVMNGQLPTLNKFQAVQEGLNAQQQKYGNGLILP